MMRVLTIAGALLVIAQLHRAGGGVISSELHRSFGLGGIEIGVVIGSMVLASAVAQVPMGLAFDRFGTRRTTAALALVALVGTLVFGSAEESVGLAVGRFLIGIGFGGAITVIMLLAVRWAPRERFATVAATAIASASLLGGLLGTAPLAVALERLGWTATFAAIALLTALATMLVLLVVRDAPEGERVRVQTAESLVESLRGLLAILADPGLRPLLIMGVCTIAPFACIGGLWAGPYLQDVHGLDHEQASFVLLSLVTAYNIGTLGYGQLDRRFGAHRGIVIAGAGLTALCLAVLAIAPRLPFWTAVLMLHLAMLVMPFYVTLTAQMRDLVPPQRIGRAITSMYLFGLSGAFLAQWLTGILLGSMAEVGRIGSASGYRLVFAFVILLLLAPLVAYCRAPERRNASATPVAPEGPSPVRSAIDARSARR
jgi:predicted MFS family arabinose efflux permease